MNRNIHYKEAMSLKLALGSLLTPVRPTCIFSLLPLPLMVETSLYAFPLTSKLSNSIGGREPWSYFAYAATASSSYAFYFFALEAPSHPVPTWDVCMFT